jgi:hypothetical protein
MELACNIIRVKATEIKPEYILNNIKKLNIPQYLDQPKHFNVAKKYCLPVFNKLAQELFSNHNDLGYALLLSYYISTFNNHIFPIKTSYENKLVSTANKVILYLEGSRRIDHDFHDTVDYYYSLYKIWNSSDLQAITALYDSFISLCTEYKYNTKYEYRIVNIIDKMFYINDKMAAKLLLQNYNMYMDITVATNKLWSCLNNVNDINHVFLILTAELRIKLIYLTHSSKDRKDIYYKIDTEDIIKDIRTNNFGQNKIKNIINLFRSKIYKLYYVDIKKPKTNILHTFRSMFDVLYNRS